MTAKKSQRVPCIYMPRNAGPSDWRNALVPGVQARFSVNRPVDGPLPCGEFKYAGPINGDCEEIIRLNRFWLTWADMLFHYMDGPLCDRTVHEIGWADREGIPVHIFVAPGVDYRQHRYVLRAAVAAPAVSIVEQDDLPKVLARIIADWKPR